MATYAKLNNLTRLAVLGGAIALSGCNDEDLRVYQRAYEQSCREAATVRFDTLTPKSTCNGLPGLHAAAVSTLPLIQDDAARVVQYAVEYLHFDVDQAAPGSGQTAAMMAVAAGRENMARELVLRSDPRRRDARGRGLLDVLAESKFPNYDHLLLGRADLFERLTEGRPSAIALARANHNLPFLWRAVRLTNRPDLLRGADVSFFFDPSVAEEPTVLDAVDPLYRASFSGSLDGQTVANYALLHYAAERLAPELVRHLLRRGAPANVVSSRGSPLALALGRARPDMTAAEQMRFSATVDALLSSPDARRAPDVLPALVKAGRPEWLGIFLSEGLSPGSYASLVWRGESVRNSPLQQALLRCYPATPGCDKRAINATMAAGLRAPPNDAGQNAAHTFYALVPIEDYQPLAGGSLAEGFRWFTLKAAAEGLLDQDDVWRMRPVHHWLASEARRAGRDRFDDQMRLALLLLKTTDVTTLTVGHDSVLGLAVMSGNPHLVTVALTSRPELRPLIDLPNAAGRSPRVLARDSSDKEMRRVFDGYP